LQQRNLSPEDWGGETLVTPVSALKGDKIPDLLESLLLQAEIMELRADPKATVEATIVEAQMEQGLGCTATVIINEGTLKPGDTLVCGSVYCRVRSMMNEHGKPLKEAPPATPVKIIGWSGVPEAGLAAKGVKNEKEARELAENFAHEARNQGAPVLNKGPVDVASLFAALNNEKKTLKVLIKADVQGSAEALEGCLKAIKSQKVGLEVIEASVGLISKNDVNMAGTSGAVIVAFNTRFDTGVAAVAKHQNVRIVQHNIIYELIEQVEGCMAELLDPEFKEVKLGAAEVRQVFNLSKGIVAGCMVTEGRILRDAHARLIRKNAVIHEGKLSTIKRVKEDASEVKSGYECGIRMDGFDDYQPKDIIECIQFEKVPGVL
jgi:translation initiation factor IF-2